MVAQDPPHLRARGANLVEAVRQRARQQPDAVAYTFLLDGERRLAEMRYRQLDHAACNLAQHLLAVADPGSRVLLLYSAGLDFVRGLFGCLYASMIAVPITPPNPYQTARRIAPRIRGIALDAEATVILTTEPLLTWVQQVREYAPEIGRMKWLVSDAIDTASAAEPPDVSLRPDGVAVLQYSSGSTGAPKGIVVTHANIRDNVAMIRAAFNATEESIVVSWLPHDHDMGLISAFMQPVFGSRLVFFSPLHFIQRPTRWLSAIADHRASISGAPNFAFDLCSERSSEEDRRALDLSCWDIAFTGAETIQCRTLDRFATLFQPAGFRRESFFPAYGLAEATLMVSGGPRGRVPTVVAVERDALAEERVVLCAEGGRSRRIVGCGRPLGDMSIAIVNPRTLRRCVQNEVGEIWIAGPTVAQGYWNRAEETARSFEARLPDEARSEPYLRTGDLGFVLDGEVFITGRLKDIIIIRGQGFHAEAIEQTVLEACAAGEIGGVIAFSFTDEEREHLVLAIEKGRGVPGRADGRALADFVRSAVLAQHGIPTHAVLWLRPGGLARTPNRKLQRERTRALFFEKKLPLLASFH